jgi:hypothetical protein
VSEEAKALMVKTRKRVSKKNLQNIKRANTEPVLTTDHPVIPKEQRESF